MDHWWVYFWLQTRTHFDRLVGKKTEGETEETEEKLKRVKELRNKYRMIQTITVSLYILFEF